MNRKFWEHRSFTNVDIVDYPCPKCHIGTLRKTKLLVEDAEDEESPYAYQYGTNCIFSAIFKCSRNSCGEVVSLVGACTLDYPEKKDYPHGGYEVKPVNIYVPKFFYPNLKLFVIPYNVPKEIKEQINLAFSHYFNDLSSCANRVRVAVELLLNDIKAPKYRMTKKKKRYYFKYNLHDRIKHFGKKKKYKDISNLLLAIKFIGNEGSHVGKVELIDVLDAFQFLHDVLDRVYLKRREVLLRNASQIAESGKLRSMNED